jgi:hypothetical protein
MGRRRYGEAAAMGLACGSFAVRRLGQWLNCCVLVCRRMV